MQSLPRRATLRALCGCAAGFLLLPRAGAESVASPNASSAGALDPWHEASGHMDRATSMASSIVSSLDGLTDRTARALEQVDTMEQKLGALGKDLEALKRKKEEMLEEYRKGMFCSGCGKTRSQILAAGETFPHPGQKIVRPTPQQIASKERELQAPIDRTQQSIDRTRKEMDDTRYKANAGLEQIRVGVRLWRTATSYAEASLGAGVSKATQAFGRQQSGLKKNLDLSQRAAAVAKTEGAVNLARSEVRTWQRLLAKHKSDTDEFAGTSARTRQQIAEREGEQRRKIMDFISRGKLFARVGGPPAVPIYYTALDGEMGASYLMGRLPEPARPTETLASVLQFCNTYRAAGGQFLGASQAASRAVIPAAAPTPTPRGPSPAAPSPKLLDALP